MLGALMEKQATTPEYYPLSLNALVNACNQKSNRDPVVDYDDHDVLSAVERLREKRYSLTVTGNGRVNKYEQRIAETLNLGRRESAVICVLLLRGPQTLGEIKDRCERLHSFADLAEAESVLEKLAELPAGALVKKLPRQPGQKEARYAHLLCGEPLESFADLGSPAPATGRIGQLEAEIQQLRADFEDLKRRFEILEAQLR